MIIRFQAIIEGNGGDLNQLTEYDLQHYVKKREDKKVSTRQKEYWILHRFLSYYGWHDRMNGVEYREEKSVSIERKSIENVDIAKIKLEIEKMNPKRNGDWKKGGKIRVTLLYTLILQD